MTKFKAQMPNQCQNPKSKKFLSFGLGALFVVWILTFGIFNNAFAFDLNIPQYQENQAGKNLASFLEWAFIFAIAAAGILALLMIMIAGFQYITAAGSESRAGAAKSRIQNAIIGLILALCSYLILNTINPDLVKNLSLPGLTPIEGPSEPLKMPGVSSGKPTQLLGMSCDTSADCFYDLECVSQDKFICAKNPQVKYDNKTGCEEKEKGCGGTKKQEADCDAIPTQTCREQNIGTNKKYNEECEDTSGDKPQGNCFDSRLVCRPFNEEERRTGQKKCFPPSLNVCEDKNDCDQSLGYPLICNKDNFLCYKESGEIPTKPNEDLFVIVKMQINDKIYAFVPRNYNWLEETKTCKQAKGINKFCIYYFGLPEQEIINTEIECRANDYVCMSYKWAKKEQLKDLEGNLINEYKKADCNSLGGGNWGEEGDINKCPKERNEQAEWSVCCKNKAIFSCCSETRELNKETKEDWKKIGWTKDCLAAFDELQTKGLIDKNIPKEFIAEYPEYNGLPPGECWELKK